MSRRTFALASGTLLVASLLPETAHAQTVKADHTTVNVNAIPAQSIAAAQALRMSFSHASVGGNIWDGLTTLAANSTYAFPSWSDNDRGNPGWEAKITEFESWVAAHTNEFDVFQNKFCYIDQDASFTTYRDSMNKLASTYPTKTFVWWTMPIMTSDGDNAKRQAFNQQVRAYCAANNRALYDIADIESHKADGTAVKDSGTEALDPTQSSDGGHLSAAGSSRAAQAQWALMAQIAGWQKPTGGDATVGDPSASGGAGAQTTDPAQSAAGSDNDSGCGLARSNAPRSLQVSLALFGLAYLVRRRSVRVRTFFG